MATTNSFLFPFVKRNSLIKIVLQYLPEPQSTLNQLPLRIPHRLTFNTFRSRIFLHKKSNIKITLHTTATRRVTQWGNGKTRAVSRSLHPIYVIQNPIPDTYIQRARARGSLSLPIILSISGSREIPLISLLLYPRRIYGARVFSSARARAAIVRARGGCLCCTHGFNTLSFSDRGGRHGV